MQKLSYAGPFTVRSYSVLDLVAHEIQHSEDVEEVTFSTHEIALVHNDRESRERWNGTLLEKKAWANGSVSFLPKGSSLSAELIPGDYRETLITLNDSVFESVSAGLVDGRQLDLRYADVTSPEMTAIAQAVRQIVTSEDAKGWPLLVHSASTAMAAALIRQLAPQASAALEKPRPGLSPERKRRLLEYIDAHLAEPITLEDLAQVASMSPHHLIRSFKAAVGMTPFRWLMQERIRRAKLLLAGDMPLSEVAYTCGFASQSHFTTVFKRAMGITPSAWRRSLCLIGSLMTEPWEAAQILAITAGIVA